MLKRTVWPNWRRHLLNLGCCLAAFGLSSAALAAAAAHSPLERLVALALENDPRIIEVQERQARAQAEADHAGAWEAPELAGGALADAAGRSGLKATLSLSQALPLGGARSALAGQGALRAEAARQGWNALRAAVSGELVARLARLRQSGEELPVLRTGQDLCRRALARLGRLAFLSPEQAASRQAFRWALEGLELHQAELEQEREELCLAIGRMAGLAEPDPAWEGLVPHREVWPDWPGADGEAPALQEARREAEAAGQGLKAARAAAWPGLALGPVLESEPGEDGGASRTFAGVEATLSLPLWGSRNLERRQAEAENAAAARRLGVVEREHRARGRVVRKRYERLKERLAALSEREEAGVAQIERIRADYLAGRVSASLALESLRQFQEMVEARHRQELAAIDAYWQGRALSAKEDLSWR